MEDLIRLLRETDPDRMRARWRDEDELMRRALNLALDLDTFEALRRGETVPLSKLDPIWVAKYGIRS
jgi:hypothetical protein